MRINKPALRESLADTALALPIAWGLSYISLLVLMSMGVENAFTLSIFQTMILCVGTNEFTHYLGAAKWCNFNVQ